MVVDNRTRDGDVFSHRNWTFHVHGHLDRTVYSPCTTCSAWKVEGGANKPRFKQQWTEFCTRWHWIDCRECAVFIGRDIGHPFTAKPNLDREAGERRIHQIEQAALDGHGLFSVHFATGGKKENLSWNADIEFNLVAAWHVVLWVDQITNTDWVHPIPAAEEANLDHMCASACVIRERPSNGEGPCLCIRFNAGNWNSIHKKVDDGDRRHAIHHEWQAKVIHQRSIDHKGITSSEGGWCFRNGEVGLTKNHKLRCGVRTNQSS